MSTVSMFRRVGPLRAGLAGAGALLLAGLVTAGMAVADPGDTEDVDLGVVVLGAPPPGGALAFSVASASATLTEAGSTALIRQFTGTLPTVTVTDTRDNVPADVFWHVVGSATDFIGNAAQPNIPAAHLGWEPAVINAGAQGLVAPGDRVESAADIPATPPQNHPYVGLVEQEFLFQTEDSATVAPEGQWTANADLFLRTPANVAAGTYHSTLTLSLFE